MTCLIPLIVTDVSAMLVDTMHFLQFYKSKLNFINDFKSPII